MSGRVYAIPDTVMEACSRLGARPRRQEIDGIDLFWAEKGNGPSILALHGFSSCFYTWRALFTGLGEGFRIIAPDLPGFGCSGEDPRDEYGLEFFCRVLGRFVQSNGYGPLTVCGHSYGGLIAWMLATTSPELVERLILIAPPVPGEERSQADLIEHMMLYAYADLSAIDRITFDVYRSVNIRTPFPLKNLKRFPKIQSFGDDVGVPCMLMWGDKDRILDPSNASYWCHHHPISSFYLYEGAGHCPHEESPAEFIRKMHDFVCLKGKRPSTHMMI